MRTYSNFLLFEEVLDFAPQSDTTLYQFIQDMTRPAVRVVSADCQTTVGTMVPMSYEIEGLIELATDATITKTRIDTILATGTYSVAVRDLYSCVSPSGICVRCYQGTYIDKDVPAINDMVHLLPEYNYQTDVVLCNGIKKVFTLTETSADYEKALVLINGVIQTTGYSISGTTLTMAVAPVNGTHIVIKFYKTTTQPFVGWLANSYSGSLLGMKPLPTQPLHIRPSLAQSLYSDEQLNIMALRLQNYKFIPSDSLQYVENIHDKLEKAIYIGMLYGIFSNVNN